MIYAPLMASKYLLRVSYTFMNGVFGGRILFRLIVESLGLLLELLEAALSVLVDGILGDLALHGVKLAYAREVPGNV
jgi:hypothetical protein